LPTYDFLFEINDRSTVHGVVFAKSDYFDKTKSLVSSGKTPLGFWLSHHVIASAATQSRNASAERLWIASLRSQ
jgi:hypothetical protein